MATGVTGRFRMLLALAACIPLVALAGPVSALASPMPPEGIFDSCSLGTAMATCVQRLQVMHQGGFQVVVFPVESSLPAMTQYADAAQSLGMSVMWEISQPQWWQEPPTSTSMDGYYGSFATACGCTQNGDVLAYMIRWLSQLPATYGYYAADDSMLAPGDQAGVARYVAAIKAQDPVHMVMIGAADQSQIDQYVSIADLTGAMIYPVTTSSLLPVADNQSMWDGVAQTAADAEHSADRAGRQSAFILQAFTFGDNLLDGETIGVCTPAMTQLGCFDQLQYPAPAAQLQLRNEVIANAHPKLILWWSFQGTYGQAGNDTYSIYPTGATADARWAGLTAAIQAAPPSTPPIAHAATNPPAVARGSQARMQVTGRTHRGRTGRRHHAVWRAHRHARRHARRRAHRRPGSS
jgi:hypothetical protein